MLVAKDYSNSAQESTTDIKAVGAKNSIQKKAGALENLMQSIYHVSLCYPLFLKNFSLYLLIYTIAFLT